MDTSRVAGDLTPEVEEIARGLCAPWGCGVEAEGRGPAHDAMAAHVAKLQGRAATPDGCPLRPLYRDAPSLVLRAVRALAAMEDGLSDRSAYAGGVKAVDVAALAIVRRGRNARDRSDEAHRERDRKRDELERAAAGKARAP